MTKKANLDPEIQNKKDIPLLINEEVWIDFFNAYGSLKIKIKYSKLAKLYNEIKDTERLLSGARKEKKRNIDRVLVLSEAVNKEGNEAALQEMEETQHRIQMLNSQIETLELNKLKLNERMKKLNFEILQDTVKVAYEEIRKQEKMLDNASRNIEEIKEKLNQAIDRKHNIEQQKNQLYRLVHGLIGWDEANRIDENYLED